MPQGEVAKRKAEARKDMVLGLFRQGLSRAEVAERGSLGVRTIEEWRKKDPDFRRRMDHAVEVGRTSDQHSFIDFLTFREQHFAYVDMRAGKHPVTGGPWVKRARNSWYQMDAASQLEGHKRLIMVLPPGHIKTTFFSIERPVYDIFRDRNFRATVVQKNQDEAAKIVAAVQERLECDHYHYFAERLREQGDAPIDCPVCVYSGTLPFKPELRSSGGKWGAYGFKVAGRTSGEKDDTYQAKGVGGQIQGVRADRIILDDVQDPNQAVRSEKDSTDMMEWFRAVILGRVFDYQQVVVLANFFADNDFAHLLIENQSDWPVINYPAILNEERKQVLCPEVWTFDGLMEKRKEVGESRWHYTWMQEAGTLDSQTFKREALEAARDESYTIGEVPHAVTDIFLGCDPATAASGYCAMVVWGLDRRTKQRYLIDVFNKKGMRNWGNVIDQLLYMTEEFSPRTVIVEGNNTQKGFINEDSLHRGIRSAGAKLRIYQTVTGSGARAEQTNFDITTIGGLFDAGLVTIPYGGTFEDRARVDEYITQLCAWRTDERTGNSIKWLVRDLVMATLFAESEAFLVAKRDAEDRPSRRPQAPSFAANKDGSWRWRKPKDRARPKLKSLSQDEIDKLRSVAP